MQEVNALMIEPSFIRGGLRIKYTLHDDTFQDRFGKTRKFVRVDTLAFYRITNITSDVKKLPFVLGLPNPLIDEMKEKCRVTSVRVTHSENSQTLSLDAAEAKFRQEIKDDSKQTIRFVLQDIEFEPSQTMEIVIKYSYAKEEEDNEIYQTLYPVDGITIEIEDKGPTVRRVFCKSIGPHTLNLIAGGPSEGSSTYRLSRFVLPRQGAVVWWKKVPTDQP